MIRMAKASWNGEVLAESNEVEKIQGLVFFPARSVKMQYLQMNNNTDICPWGGKVSYFDVIVGREINNDGAMIYIEPSENALHLKDHIAFRRGIMVEEDE